MVEAGANGGGMVSSLADVDGAGAERLAGSDFRAITARY